MCAGVQYHDSFYVFAFGVDPAHRRQVRPQLLLAYCMCTALTHAEMCHSATLLGGTHADESLSLQGYGKRIMFGMEVWVLEHGLPLKISATVDAAHTRLIAFYQSLGATIESSGEHQQHGTQGPPAL